jgi:hypothetical protein
VRTQITHYFVLTPFRSGGLDPDSLGSPSQHDPSSEQREDENEPPDALWCTIRYAAQVTEGSYHSEIHILDSAWHNDPSVPVNRSAALHSRRCAPDI